MPHKAKEAALVVLVLVNVILLFTVLAMVYQLPQASAQAVPDSAGGGVRYLAVSGQVQTGFDAMYVLDAGQQQLYAWIPNRSAAGASMLLRSRRDLRQDFAKQPTPAVPPRTR